MYSGSAQGVVERVINVRYYYYYYLKYQRNLDSEMGLLRGTARAAKISTEGRETDHTSHSRCECL